MNSSEFLQIQDIYTVSQLNRETKLLLNDHFLTIRVEGEISNLSSPSSGHIYFSLKDENAQIRCAMFRTFRRKLGFVPENGTQIIVKAQVGLYETRGDYQLIVEEMEEAGSGALRRAFEVLKTKLASEGLFEQSQKKSLPFLPKKIGIITSPSGAAVRDILFVLKKRFPSIPVLIYPATVQGDSAKNEIVDAINAANKRQECDVLVLARGGGSLEDLWPFNEEPVARAIFTSHIPIITGIGHETDYTIADFTADLRAPTPSAAAEHITPDYREWLTQIKRLENRIIQLTSTLLNHQRTLIDWLFKRLQQQEPSRQLQSKSQRLDELELRLNQIMTSKLHRCISTVDTRSARLWQHNPTGKIESKKDQLHFFTNRLSSAIKHRLEFYNQQLSNTGHTLHAVSPLATLDRGYAIVTQHTKDKIIRSTENIKKGDLIRTRLAKGQIISQIEEIDND